MCQDGYYGYVHIPGWALGNHLGQNVYYICVLDPDTDEYVHQGCTKHLQVKEKQKQKKQHLADRKP